MISARNATAQPLFFGLTPTLRASALPGTSITPPLTAFPVIIVVRPAREYPATVLHVMLTTVELSTAHRVTASLPSTITELQFAYLATILATIAVEEGQVNAHNATTQPLSFGLRPTLRASAISGTTITPPLTAFPVIIVVRPAREYPATVLHVMSTTAEL